MEKKIIKSTTNLQKSLFEHKTFLKTFGDTITKSQAQKITLECARLLLSIYEHEESILKLILSINPSIVNQKQVTELEIKNKIYSELFNVAEQIFNETYI